MSTVLKSNKYKTCQQKITNLLIIERHVLVDSYFCTHVSRLLNFDINDIVSFDTKYFFISQNLFTKDGIYSKKKKKKKSTKNDNKCRHLSTINN